MGKSDKKKRKHDSSSSDSDSSSSDSEPDRKRHKKDKKGKKDKKHKKDKKSKKSKDDKEKRMLKEAKKFLKQQKKDKEREEQENMPLPAGQAIEPISADDYFIKNPEFSVWLTFKHGKYFNDLPATETRALFADEFVAAWNARQLPKRFYDGIKAGVSRTNPGGSAAGRAAPPTGGAGAVVRAKTNAELEDEKMEARSRARDAARHERKRERGEAKEWLDEHLPKATGREAKQEQRAVRREAAREREASPDMNTVGFGGGDVMGGGGSDDFRAAKARMEASQRRRDEVRFGKEAERRERLNEYQRAEEEKMAQFRAMVGLGPGQKVEIRKRE